MDVKVINPFLKSTINMFKEMFSIEADALEPFILDHHLTHRWEISGIIGITGKARGVMALRMHKVLLDKLLEKSGVTVKDEEEKTEMADAMVGECINIIGGNALGDLSEFDIDITVPVVIQGENHRIAWPKIAPVIGVPFRTSIGIFEVNICFKE